MSHEDDTLGALLGLSIEMEAARRRHPSGKDIAMPIIPDETYPAYRSDANVVLTLADRCDHCSQAAVYRIWRKEIGDLDFCLSSFRKNFPSMAVQGWAVVGGNPDLLREFGVSDG